MYEPSKQIPIESLLEPLAWLPTTPSGLPL